MNNSSIVISSRVRIARNIRGYKFPQLKDFKDSKKVTELILDRFKKSEDIYNFYKIENLTDIEKGSYVEKHLISPVHINSKLDGSFLLRDDNIVTIMINEEDHLRIQVLLDGLKLDECWKIADEIDDFLEEDIEYAYDKDYGYMTSCPTNIGTGLRASVMLHLPAITITKKLIEIKVILEKFGLTIRGIYGEGSKALGGFYQISNQRTLGETEEEIIAKLNRLVKQVVKREEYIRDILREKIPIEIEDEILRSLGILLYNKKIDYPEAMKHLSNVKLGIDLNLFSDKENTDLIKLMGDISPANLQKYLNKILNERDRDIYRSDYIKSKL